MSIFMWPEGVDEPPDRDVINRGNVPMGVVLIPDCDGLMAHLLGTNNNYICGVQ
jgi:hypothetical protein